MGDLRNFFQGVKEHGVYRFAVIMFLAASAVHLFGIMNPGTAVILQAVFLVWAGGLSLKKRLVFWPAFIVGALFLIVSSGLTFHSENSLDGAAEALRNDNAKKARDMLDLAASDEVKKSDQYIHLQELVSARIQQLVADQTARMRTMFQQNNFAEAKNAISLILDYDSGNREAAYYAEVISQKEIYEFEKQLSPDALAKITELRKSVNLNVYKKNYPDARKNVEDFLGQNTAYGRTHLIIAPILASIEKSEKGEELDRQRQLNYQRIDEAVALYNKKEFGKSVEKLEEALSHDGENARVKNMLEHTKQVLSNQRWNFWKKVGGGVVVVLVIVLYIRFKM